MHFLSVYEHLFDCYGAQHWWPGESPFEIMVGAVLTQNTAWTNVEKAINNLKGEDALDPEWIVSASHEQLANLLKPAGYFNIKAQRLRNYCQWYLLEGGYETLLSQDTEKLRRGLLSVNGVGYETADDILLYAFDRAVFVIDAYTRRIFSRLGLVEHDVSYESLRKLFETNLKNDLSKISSSHASISKKKLNKLYNEYHALIVVLGKELCRKKPRCSQCCLKQQCPASGLNDK